MKTIRILSVLSLALAGLSAKPMSWVDLVKPDQVLLDGKPSARVAIAPDGTVTLAGGEASFVKLVWKGDFPEGTTVYGSMWERTYGRIAWRAVSDRRKPNGNSFAWYVLVADGTRTDGYGVQVQPNAFANWKVSPDRLELLLDVRAGSNPVRLGTRRLEAVRLVSRRGGAKENAFAAGRAFCRAMCPNSRLPKAPVYGYNDWYCRYGRNTATNYLADVRHFMAEFDRLGPCANRPFAVIDDGWQISEPRGWRPDADGEWTGHNKTWGMPMEAVAREIKGMGARPGLWYRPFRAWSAMPESWWIVDRSGKKVKNIDPTAPALGEAIARNLERFRKWGYELVKIDFLTLDWNGGCGGLSLKDRVVGDCATWRDRSRTTAEVILGHYRRMRAAAGDMLIIGCNAIDHFAAGLFEIQRTGEDVSGFGWKQTRFMGVNTLAMRAIQNNIFYQGDPDCVCLAVAGFTPWGFNRQWLDVVARSGAALFVSWPRDLAPAGGPVARAIAEAWRTAAHTTETAEPLDWQTESWPRHWQTAGRDSRAYDWRFVESETGDCGTEPFTPREGRRAFELKSGDCTARVEWTGRVTLLRDGRVMRTIEPLVEVRGRRCERPEIWEFERQGGRVICRNDYSRGLKVIWEIAFAPGGELKVRQNCAFGNGWGSATGRVGVKGPDGVKAKKVRVAHYERPVLEWTFPVGK